MILIDVRTKDEYENNHIEGAILHNIIDMTQGIFPEVDKNEEILVYCTSGSRSNLAKIILEKEGFKKVTDAGSINNLI